MTPYKSEGWIWSNQTTTGCGNCYYCWNGRCAYGGRCYGTEMRIVNGAWQTVPVGSPVGKEKDQWETSSNLKR